MKMALHYRLKILLISFLFFLSQGLVFAEVLFLSEGRGLFSSFLTSSLRSMFPLAICHVVLYSDLITMFIDEINIQIKYSPKYHNVTTRIEFLKNVKLLHMDLWKLVGQINIFFGWNLLILIINSFIYITYQLYWIFLALELKWPTLGMVEGLASLLYGMVSLFVLVNSCQSGTLKMKYLVASIELYAFWTAENIYLHHLKQEIFSQISYLPIYITGSEFFTIDRKYLAGIAANCCMYIMIFIQFFVTSDL
ncbi:hypothetical protein Bhyg_07630 [Pseudolycoriella hygida]|uniref:Gustatory receptor n=1 Tax=Pseudolycoriella hygida TaxID=35572 RepID=A0A9Q0N3W6_9DIPT|nr:hypothetical protein Bhyg_07630 [Pseudolycoriella hygida]